MPSTIRNLKKLVTLDTERATFSDSFPTPIFKMKYLKHLLFRANYETYKMENILTDVYLPNIETLDECSGIFLKAGSLRKLSNLRKLKINGVGEQHIDVISGTKPISEKLQELCLKSISTYQRMNLSNYHHLAKLRLNMISISYYPINFPQNLIDLTLEYTEVLDDLMKVLKELPRLEILTLKHCGYKRTPLDFSGANSFPELQVLAIWGDEIPELIVDQTGIPKLYKFVFDFRYLNAVPPRLRKIMVKPSHTSIEEEKRRRRKININ